MLFVLNSTQETVACTIALEANFLKLYIVYTVQCTVCEDKAGVVIVQETVALEVYFLKLYIVHYVRIRLG